MANIAGPAAGRRAGGRLDVLHLGLEERQTKLVKCRGVSYQTRPIQILLSRGEALSLLCHIGPWA
jgi:hypothetical protein